MRLAYIDLKWRIVRLRLLSMSLAYRNAKRRYSTRLYRARARASMGASSHLACATCKAKRAFSTRFSARFSLCRCHSDVLRCMRRERVFWMSRTRVSKIIDPLDAIARVCCVYARARRWSLCVLASQWFSICPYRSLSDQIFFYHLREIAIFLSRIQLSNFHNHYLDISRYISFFKLN